jgi:acyl-CoA synthetase (AMP-forming)/AMP-acid ligase II
MGTTISRYDLDLIHDIPSWDFSHLRNVGQVVTESARYLPDAMAVASPVYRRSARPIEYKTVSFAELDAISNQIAAGLHSMGLQPGTRLALMVPPGIEFVSFVFGLFKAGAVIILIDPGIGLRNMIRCLGEVQPAGVVGIAKAHLLRMIFSRQFRHCRTNVIVGSHWWPSCESANRFLLQQRSDPVLVEAISQQSPAAIIFTSGSTGTPKGVLYRHGVFLEQARMIQDYFGIRPGSVDVSGFPLFALFNVAMGTSTVFPRMDATRPAEINPLDFQDAVLRFDADQSFGSPALWNTVSRYAVKHGLSFPSIRRVLTAGAPVPGHVLSRVADVIHPQGQVFTPYGATEALPIACNDSRTILTETSVKTARGQGICVGRRFAGIQWKVIEISDDPIARLSDAVELPAGSIGELIVNGPIVTDQYVTRIESNPDHKIKDGDRFWHRMGDVGYLDDDQRFWFCGRKSHRVITQSQTLFTIVVEGIINTHPSIYRSALVGVGRPGDQIPAIIVEPWPEHWPSTRSNQHRLISDVREICQSHVQTAAITHVLLKRKLPVDIRHNAKIFREQLALWAAKYIKPG